MARSDQHQDYLSGLPPEQQATMSALHDIIAAILPDAEQVISYAMPAFKQGGHVVIGISAFKRHLGLYPFSGSVIPLLAEDCAAFKSSKSGITFTPDAPPSKALIAKIIKTRQAEIAAGKR